MGVLPRYSFPSASVNPLLSNSSSRSGCHPGHHRQGRTTTDPDLHLPPIPEAPDGCDRAPGTRHCLPEKPHPKAGSRTPSQLNQNPGLIKEVYIN